MTKMQQLSIEDGDDQLTGIGGKKYCVYRVC